MISESPSSSISPADFYRSMQGSNPFLRDRVSEPNSVDADVEGIHDKAFATLSEAIDTVQKGGPSTGIMLLGAAGVGKSHLLGRLYRWAEQGHHGTPVFLHNLLASPERMARYLVRATVSALAGTRAPSETPLYALLFTALKDTLPKRGNGAQGGMADLFSGKKRQEFFEAIRPSLGVNRFSAVLSSFVRSTAPDRLHDEKEPPSVRAAVEWLGGEDIDDDLAGDIGLPRGNGRAWADDADGEAVIAMLCGLSHRAKRPFILCVDQVDNLDEPRIRALTVFLQTLIDHVPNLVVITSGIKETLLRFREGRVISEAVWDRLAARRVELFRIQKPEALAIVRARLERHLQAFRDLPAVHKHLRKDEFFPIGRGFLDRATEGVLEVRPRDVIAWARAAWEAEQQRLNTRGGAAWLEGWPYAITTTTTTNGGEVTGESARHKAIDDLVAAKIAEHIALRKLKDGSLPPDADNLAELTAKLLQPCVNQQGSTLLKLERSSADPYHLRAEERALNNSVVRDGVRFITTLAANGAGNVLGRLVSDSDPPEHRIIVTDEERRPLPLGAMGKQYYQSLEKLGPNAFRHIRLNFRTYAELDAMSAVIDDAAVGDVELERRIDGSAVVRSEEVIASYHRTDRFLHHPLLAELLTEAAGASTPTAGQVVDPKKGRDHILGQLGWRLGCYVREIAISYRDAHDLDPRRDEDIRKQLVAIADQLHEERKLRATPAGDDRYLELVPVQKSS